MHFVYAATCVSALVSLVAGAAMPEPKTTAAVLAPLVDITLTSGTLNTTNSLAPRTYYNVMKICDGYGLTGGCWTIDVPDDNSFGICFNIIRAAEKIISSVYLNYGDVHCWLYK